MKKISKILSVLGIVLVSIYAAIMISIAFVNHLNTWINLDPGQMVTIDISKFWILQILLISGALMIFLPVLIESFLEIKRAKRIKKLRSV